MSDVNYSEIYSLIQMRRYSLAKQEIATAMAQEPGNAHLFYWAAYIAWLEDDEDYGLELTERGLSLAPDDIQLLHIRYKLLESAKFYEDAEEIIILLIRSFPRSADFLSDYARLMLITFHVKKSRLLCNEALRIDPENNNAKIVDLLLNLVDGKLSNAQVQLQSLLQDNPESERYLRLLLMVLIDRKQFKSALTLVQELIRKNPSDSSLIEVAIDLRRLTHWSALPLWHINRFGWPAAMGTWVGFIVLLQVDRHSAVPGMGYIVIAYLLWAVYSWIHAPIIGRWIKFRGI